MFPNNYYSCNLNILSQYFTYNKLRVNVKKTLGFKYITKYNYITCKGLQLVK